MGKPEVLGDNSEIRRLEGLAGGNFIAGEIFVDPTSDPDESDPGVSALLTGPTDGLDVLESFAKMDSVEFGILTRRISPEALQDIHKRDEEVVGRELENERRMS